MIAHLYERETARLDWSDAVPQAQAHQFAARFKAEQIGVHRAAMSDDQTAQHLDLFRLAGFVCFERDMLSQVLDSLLAIPVLLSLGHRSPKLRLLTGRSFLV